MAEKKKRLSLADRIAAQNMENTLQEEILREKSILSIVTSSKTPSQQKNSGNKIDSQDNIEVRSGSGQGQVNTVLPQGHPKGTTVSTKGQVRVNNISGQGQVSSIRSGSGQGQLDTKPEITECVLAPRQQKIYTWFLNNGITGYFNKSQIQRDINITHATIRKSITKLKNLNLIEIFEYDPVSRHQKYILNLSIKVKILSGSGQGQISSIRSRSGQGQVSGIRSGSGQGQLDTDNSSYKLVSKYLNKLTNYIEYSQFWKNQELSVKKCEKWIEEFYPDNPESLITQLMFAEKTETVLKPKTKTPVHVFYGCLLNGGLTRPKNFEFPEEKAVRIKKQEIEAQKKILADQAAIREQEKLLADQQAFLSLLENKESIDLLIHKIEKRFITSKTKISIKLYRETGQIDSKLEKALENEFNYSDEEPKEG